MYGFDPDGETDEGVSLTDLLHSNIIFNEKMSSHVQTLAGELINELSRFWIEGDSIGVYFIRKRYPGTILV